jgi:hypothetical protein
MSKSISPDLLGQAIALREAGFTVLAISQRLGIGVRTLHRHFARQGSTKGRVKAEVLERARHDLLDSVKADNAIREEAAKLVHDDLAHARHLREILLDASEHLRANTLADAAVVMRAAAAYSTAAKNTSDMLRRSLGLDRIDSKVSPDELPELVLREIDDAQAAVLQAGDMVDDPAE